MTTKQNGSLFNRSCLILPPRRPTLRLGRSGTTKSFEILLHNRWLCRIKGQKTGRAVCCYFNNNLRRVPRGYLVDSAAVMEELAEGLGLLRRVLIRSTSTITCT
jgi:hypothetical protein